MKDRDTAIALSWLPGEMNAPQVGARGQRKLAAEISKIARRYGIPQRNNSKLAQALSSLESGQEIPQELYREIAELFEQL